MQKCRKKLWMKTKIITAYGLFQWHLCQIYMYIWWRYRWNQSNTSLVLWKYSFSSIYFSAINMIWIWIKLQRNVCTDELYRWDGIDGDYTFYGKDLLKRLVITGFLTGFPGHIYIYIHTSLDMLNIEVSEQVTLCCNQQVITNILNVFLVKEEIYIVDKFQNHIKHRL